MKIFDPFDPAFDEDPFPVLAVMRSSCPVARTRPGLHVMTRHDDCSQTMLKTGTFSSSGGGTMATDLPLDGITINAADGAHHARLRRMLHEVLKPASYKAEGDWIAARAAEMIDEILPRGSVDLMQDFAYRLPARVILKLIGVSDGDYAEVRRWTMQIEDAADPVNGTFMGDFYSGKIPHPAVDAFNAYLQRLIDERRAGLKTDDLVTRMIRARDDEGRAFNDREICVQLSFLLIAGNHTTSNLIGSLLVQLAGDPVLYRRLRKDRSLVPLAIEETLRLQSPVQGIFRTAAEDVTVQGEQVAAGGKVLVHLASANRDSAVFGDPETFDIDRPNVDDHIAFGYGPHFCIGAPLARLETRHAINALLDRVGSVELQPGAQPKIWTRAVVNRGPRSLQVCLTPA
jgi:cytochrome P450